MSQSLQDTLYPELLSIVNDLYTIMHNKAVMGKADDEETELLQRASEVIEQIPAEELPFTAFTVIEGRPSHEYF